MFTNEKISQDLQSHLSSRRSDVDAEDDDDNDDGDNGDGCGGSASDDSNLLHGNVGTAPPGHLTLPLASLP